MSDVEYVVKETTKLENRLRNELDASKKANGLKKLFDSVRDDFEDPDRSEKYLDTIVKERNEFVHDGRKNLKDPRGFSRAVRNFNRDVNDAVNRRNSTPFLQAFLPLLLFLLAMFFAFGAILAMD